MKPADFRIEEIQIARINGRKRKLFRAYERKGNAFVFVGQFTAPAKTANRDLWAHVTEQFDDEYPNENDNDND